MIIALLNDSRPSFNTHAPFTINVDTGHEKGSKIEFKLYAFKNSIANAVVKSNTTHLLLKTDAIKAKATATSKILNKSSTTALINTALYSCI